MQYLAKFNQDFKAKPVVCGEIFKNPPQEGYGKVNFLETRGKGFFQRQLSFLSISTGGLFCGEHLSEFQRLLTEKSRESGPMLTRGVPKAKLGAVRSETAGPPKKIRRGLNQKPGRDRP